MAFSFGAPTPAATPPTFSLGFGSTTPAFGAGAPAIGSTVQKPAAPFSFGASSSSSLFGPSSGTSTFGTTPAFGFGSSTSQPSPSIFGTTNASPFGQSLGAQSTPAFSFPSFGAASTPSNQLTVFGQQQQTQLAPSTFGTGLPPQPAADLSAIKELEALRDAFLAQPGNQRCLFQYLFLNVVDDPAARIKPPGVNELKWREAVQRAGGLNNVNHLHPVLALGFKDLLLRKSVQDSAVQEHDDRMRIAVQAVRQLGRKQDTIIRDRMEQVGRKQRELRATLLRCVRCIDMLESRFAHATGYYPSLHTKQEPGEITKAIASLEAQIAAGGVGSLKRRLAQVDATVRLQGPSAGSGRQPLQLPKSDLEEIFGILQHQALAIEKLLGVLQRASRDAAMLAEGTTDDMTVGL